jgi:hypothetical protein
MKLIHMFGLSAVLLSAALPALAFQEQTVGGAAPQAQSSDQTAAPEPGVGAKPAEMQLTPEEAKKPVEGTEVRIPGLGKLGVLPKMDFGLELLYGANETRPVLPDPQDQTDDLQIRGSVKHNF